MNDAKMSKKPISGLKRDTIDKYYTKESVVNTCLEYIKQYLNIQQSDLIIEPSAGNGAFISGIKLLSNNYLFYDLKPEHPQIITQDYLAFNITDVNTVKYDNIHVIGNPPFGRQSSLAIKFIKKSCEFCNSISFILPKSFKKDSLKKHFPLNFHLVFEIDLPDKSFLVDNKEHDVPCIFQIWEKKDINRNECIKLTPQNFTFVKKNDNPDISFRRVGVNAGVVSKDIDEKSSQSHYFIKFTNDKSIDENLKKLSDIKYESNNTVGPKSISKQELISKFNQLLI
jgi:predicted RNA methylase